MEQSPIFYLENDENDFVLLNHALRKEGFPNGLRWFRSCDQLRAGLENASPAELPVIILSDLKLDGETGLDFLAWRAAQDHLRDIPVYMFSSGRLLEEVLESLERYAAAYIFKPSNLE